MFGIGAGEMLLLLVLALLVLGPERMPRLARDIGRTVGDLRRTSDELREEFLNADALVERAARLDGPREPGAIPGGAAPADVGAAPANVGAVPGAEPGPAAAEEAAASAAPADERGATQAEVGPAEREAGERP